MKTVFVVDDSPTARASIKYTLEKAGFMVEMAVDGADALKKIREFKGEVDVFLFDINMPNMDGIQLIKEVRSLEDHQFTPILFLTTESQEPIKMEAKNAGANGWIVKPFQADQFTSLITRLAGD